MCIGIFISSDQVTWEPARKNDVKTAHNAVKYCIYTQNEYELPKIECFFKGFVLVICWELSRLRPSKMGAYLTSTVNSDTNAVKYCIMA